MRITAELLRLMPIGMILTNGDRFGITRLTETEFRVVNGTYDHAMSAEHAESVMQALGGPVGEPITAWLPART